ncbi:hypothetical protein TCAL_13324 [Tigriopus californicus]|uniref:Tyr recombinase domain-containing protein n=1 Tax=Tigriopus californicus TaxID=6832 RepID=A0A553N8R7_TIGCA|nr:hypothetical protein TCAL_13324 [Tigriopus californicus]|eukprot:TCALIF_13324-PA protein Name:"Protein of unknown function" AED:0.16 eAED:0.16 QI:0/-1/0/1/-1/1/1/0/251
MALAAIADKHVGLNLSNPCLDPGVRMSMQGYRRRLGRPATQAKGLTKALLQGFINQAIGLDIDSNGRKRATLVMWREAWRELTCFLTLARFADLQHVTRRDISVDHLRHVIVIQFWSRKNDQLHVGHWAIMHGTSTRYCPVRLTSRYLAMLPKDPNAFMLPDMRPNKSHIKVTYAACRRQQKWIMQRIGTDPSPYGLHSARVGGTTYLKGARISESDIGSLGGLAPGSSQPDRYSKSDVEKWKQAASALRI